MAGKEYTSFDLNAIGMESTKTLQTSLADKFGSEAPVLLCGSLISAFSPTNIPNGASMTNVLFEFLLKEQVCFSESDLELIEKIYWGNDDFGSGMPFEMLFEGCSDIRSAKKMFREFFSSRECNSFHQEIIQFLKAGTISSIITPNYDDCFEQAAAMHGFADYQPVYCPENIHENTLHSCFYVHGSIRAKSSDDLVVTMSDEKIMPLWKKALITEMVRYRYVIVIGYSGLDFEICPVLQELITSGVCKGIIYNNFSAKISYNMQQLLNASPPASSNSNIFCIGDVKIFMKTVFSVDVEGEMCRDGLEFSKILSATFPDKPANTLWAFRLLSSMGCVNQGLLLADEFVKDTTLTDSETKSLFHIKGALLYKSGRYVDAAESYKRARKISINKSVRASNIQQDIMAFADELECYRNGFFLIRAALFYIALSFKQFVHRHSMRGNTFDATKAMLHYRLTMLWKNIILQLRFDTRFSRKLMFSLYKTGISNALKSGNRVLLQNYDLEIMSIRSLVEDDSFDAFMSIINQEMQHSVKQSGSGYKELAAFFEQAIYRRRAVMNKENIQLREIHGKAIGEESIAELETLARHNYRCGIYPEAYKCLFLLNKASIRYDVSDAASQLIKAETLFDCCQYARNARHTGKRFINALAVF